MTIDTIPVSPGIRTSGETSSITIVGSATALPYLDMPLPIGHGQTISQPYIVALMTDLLDCRRPGAGGRRGQHYQAAVLSRLARQVHTIEIVPALAIACRERLARLGYANVVVPGAMGAGPAGGGAI